jgi:hypothetical protein
MTTPAAINIEGKVIHKLSTYPSGAIKNAVNGLPAKPLKIKDLRQFPKNLP